MKENLKILFFLMVCVILFISVIFFVNYGKNLKIDKRIDKKLIEYNLIKKK